MTALTVDRFGRTPGGVLGVAITSGLLGLALLAPVLFSRDPFATVAVALAAPSWSHPFGTDDLGRDLLALVIHGIRTTAIVIGVVVSVSTVLGASVGAVAGYRRGIVDDLLMRVTEIVQSVPRFFLAILVVALLGPGLDNVMLVLALTSWPWLARVVRAEVLALRELEYVEAARASGASDVRILLRHLLPAVVPTIAVLATLMAARVVLLEAGLSFLGLGDPNLVSLGYLVNNAQRFVRVAWWMSVFPGAVIALITIGLHLSSDAAVDAADPLRGDAG